MSSLAEQFSQACDSLVGVPYRYQGSSVDGLDCVGLIICAAGQIGIDNRPLENPKRRMKRAEKELYDKLSLFCDRLDLTHGYWSQAQRGDIVVLDFPEIQSHHTEIVVDTPLGFGVVHANLREGKVVRSVDLPADSEICSAWRIREDYGRLV